MSLRPFEEIVAEHGEMVLRVCRSMLAPADADDAWSETFLSAMRAYPELRPDSNIRGWLATIARRKAIDHIRRTSRTAPTDDVPDTPTWDRPSDDESLRDAVRALPPKQQGAIIFHYLADLPYAQVGELIGSSAAAARRSASDGIAALRQTYTRQELR